MTPSLLFPVLFFWNKNMKTPFKLAKTHANTMFSHFFHMKTSIFPWKHMKTSISSPFSPGFWSKACNPITAGPPPWQRAWWIWSHIWCCWRPGLDEFSWYGRSFEVSTRHFTQIILAHIYIYICIYTYRIIHIYIYYYIYIYIYIVV